MAGVVNELFIRVAEVYKVARAVAPVLAHLDPKFSPGRNLAIIIEVAARNLSLKRMGYSAAHELDRRLNEMIMKKSGQID